MLKMKPACERCGASLLADAANAYVCSFECTFCEACTTGMGSVCRNCAGELVRRPRRTRSVASAATGQLAARVRRWLGGG